jgi:rSAM/selenodomain-associated transferase 2
MMISFVIPTLDEASVLPALLDDLGHVQAAHEVIVSDGGSTDATVKLAAAAGANVIETARGRGVQLRAGAAAARGDVLCFLHADVRLDRNAREALQSAAADTRHNAFAFSLRIGAGQDGAPTGWAYRVIERGVKLRSRWIGLPYGDQGLLVSRAAYVGAGGFQPIPLMEDVALVRALRRDVRLRILDAAVTVSARRWQRDGVWRRTARNWGLLARYLLGVRPENLSGSYAAHSADSARHASRSASESMSRSGSSSDTVNSCERAAASVAASTPGVLHGMARNKAG